MSRTVIKRISKDVVEYNGKKITRQDVLDQYDEVEAIINGPREMPDGSWKEPTSHREVTRKAFREHAEFPESVMEAFFGNFAEYRRAVGKQPTRAQQTLNTQAARAAASDELQKLWAERLSYGSNYARESNARWQIIIGCNDLHDEECDPFMRRVLMDTIKRVQPNIIVSNGDHFDAPEFGKYANDPREWDAVKRVQAGLKIFEDMRAAAPNAQIDLIEGNHEARIVRYFKECAPPIQAMLSDMHDMDMRKFLGLDRYEINYIAKSEMKGAYTDAHIRTEVRRNYKTYFDTVCAHHFPAGKNFAMTGWNGHHHSHHVHHFHNAMFGPYEWHQFGCGHRRDATYTDGTKWANGFGLIHVDTVSRLAQIEYIPVGTTFAIVGGQMYTRQPEEFYDALYPMIDKSRVIPFPEKNPPKKKGK